MAQPAFLSGGSTPNRKDTRWLRWCRMLGDRQNRLGSSADAANNPRKSDSLWQLKQKLLKSLQ
jgi:hypothetical protein